MPMKHRNRGQRRMKYKFRINGKPGGVVASESERLRNGIIPGTMNCTANCENPPFELRCIVRIREQRDISAQRSLWRAPENTISLSPSLSLFLFVPPRPRQLYISRKKNIYLRGTEWAETFDRNRLTRKREIFSPPPHV